MPDIGTPTFSPSAETAITDLDLNKVLNAPKAPDPISGAPAISNTPAPNTGLNTNIKFGADTSKYAKPLRTFDEADLKNVSGYNSFKSNPTYNPEFTPIQNTREYAAKQGTGEYLANLGAKLVSTTVDSAISTFSQNFRNVDALVNHNLDKLYSTEDNSKALEDLRYKYPTFGTGQNDDSWRRFNPFTAGKADFYGEFVPQLGFSIGTIGSTIAENLLVTAATGGLGAVGEAAGDITKLSRLFKGAEQLFEASSGITNFRKAMNVISTIKNESSLAQNIGQGVVKGAKLLANAYAMYNTAAGEASFEANNIYNQHLKELTQDFVDKNGYAPFGKDLEKIKNSSSSTAIGTFAWNIPVLLGSNLIQFGNVLKPFKSEVAQTLEHVALELTGKGVAKSIAEVAEKQITNKFLKIFHPAKEFLKEAGSEGLEEVLQSFASTGTSSYYKNVYNGATPGTSMNKALKDIWDYAGSSAYVDDFVGGFLGGALFSGIGAISNKTGLQEKLGFGSDAATEKRKKEVTAKGIDILNSVSNEDLIKYLFKPEVQNFVSQVANKENLKNASLNEDKLGYKDAQNQSVRDLIYAGLSTGKLDIALSKLDIFKELNNDDLAKYTNTTDVAKINEAKQRATELVNDIRQKALDMQSDYNTLSTKYKNKYAEGTLGHTAFEMAFKDRLYSKDIVNTDRKRAKDLRRDISVASDGVISDNILNQAADTTALNKSVKDLEYYVANAPDKTDPIYLKKKEQLDHFHAIQKEKAGKNPDYTKIAQAVSAIAKLNTVDSTYFNDLSAEENNKRVEDVLKLEDRNKLSLGYYQFLNNKPMEESVAQHLVALTTLADALKQKAKPVVTPAPTTTTTTTTSPTVKIEPHTNDSLAKKLGKGFSVTTDKDGKTVVKFSGRKQGSISTETTTFPAYNSLDELNSDIDNLKKKVNIAPTSPLTEDDLMESTRSEIENLLEPFKGLTKNPGVLPFTETRLKYENQEVENHPAWMHRIEDFLNNLFYKKGRFKDKLHLQAIAVTPFNYKTVEKTLGIPEDSLAYILKQEDPKYNLSADNENGRIINIYAEKEGDKYYLLDKDGERIDSDFENRVVQGTLVSSDVDVSKIRENTTDEEIQAIRDTNKKIRKFFISNDTFQPFNFNFSAGLSLNNGTESRKVTETNAIDEKDITGSSVYVPAKKGSSIIESPDSFHTLLVGRPYLRIEGKNPDGSPFIQYQALDNDKITPEQTEGITKALKSLSNLFEKGVITDKDYAATDEFKYISGVLQTTTNRKPFSKRTISVYYEKGKLKAAISNGKGGATYMEVLQGDILNPELSKFIADRYHNVDKKLLGEKFTDFATGKKYKTYAEYLLNADKAPLTTRVNNDIKGSATPTTAPAFIQRYSIIDYSSIAGVMKPKMTKKTFVDPIEQAPAKPKKKAALKVEEDDEMPPSMSAEELAAQSGTFDEEEISVEEVPAENAFKAALAKGLKKKSKKETPEGPAKKEAAPKGKAPATFKDALADKLKAKKKASTEPIDKVAPIAKKPATKKTGAAKSKASLKGLSFADYKKPGTETSTERDPDNLTTEDESTKEFLEGLEFLNSVESVEKITDNTLDELTIPGKLVSYKGTAVVIKEVKDGKIYSTEGRILDPIQLLYSNEEVPFKLADPEKTEPITEAEMEEVKKMLPQVGFVYNPALERVFQNRRVWGSYKNAIITIYKGAAKGTALHEAFETVYNSILSKAEQQSLIKEFRGRVGTFTTYQGKTIAHGNATDLEAKEAIADEFADFKQGNPIYEAAPKTFFQKLWDYVQKFFNKFVLRRDTTSVNEVYDKLASGQYGDVELRDSTGEYFKTGDLTKYEEFESLRTFSAHLFQKILADNKELLSALDEGQDSAVLYDYLKNLAEDYYTNPENIKGFFDQRKEFLIRTSGLTPTEVQAQAAQETRNAIIRWRQEIKPNWDDFVQSHKNFISGFGLKFTDTIIEGDEAQRNAEEKEGNKTNEYTRDTLTTDVKDSIPSSIKLLIATLTDSVFVSPTQAIDVISPISGMPSTVIDYKKLFNRLLNYLTGINRPELIKQKLEELSKVSASELNTPLANIRGQFKKLFDGVYGQDLATATEAELKLYAKFTSAFSKQRPNFFRMEINEESGGSYVLNEVHETNTKKFEKQTLDGIRTAQWLNKKKKFWLKWNSGAFKINAANLPAEISQQDDYIAGLEKALPRLGINYFTKERLDALDDRDAKNLLFNYNEMVHFLAENKKPMKKLTLYSLGIFKSVQAIAQIFAKVEFDESDPMHLNPESEAQQNIIDNNFLSTILSDARNFQTKEEFIAAHPYYQDSFIKNSLLLEKIFSEPDLNKRISQLSIISGIGTKTMAAASEPELFITRLNAGLQTPSRDAIFSTLENSDGNINYAIQTGNYVSTSQVYNGELADILYNYLLDEIAPAIEFVAANDNLKKENEELHSQVMIGEQKRSKGSSLQFFSTLIPAENVAQLHALIDGFKDVTLDRDVHSAIEEAMAVIPEMASLKEVIYNSFMNELITKEVEKDIDYLTRSGYLKKNGNKDNYTFYQLDDSVNKKEGFTLQEIKNLLTLRKVNYTLNNIEMFKLFFGAPYFYKDPMKRFKSFMSPRQTTMNSAEFNDALTRIFNEGVPENDQTYHRASNDLSFYSVTDIKTHNALLNEVNPAYAANESTDAQMSMTLPYIKEMLWKEGKWTDQQEDELQLQLAYQRQALSRKINPKTGNPYYTYTGNLEQKDLATLEPYQNGLPTLAYINIIKPIQSGPLQADVFIPSLLKTSIYPLTYSMVEGTKMENIFLDLLQTNTAAFGFKSAHKVGQLKSGNIIAPNGSMNSLGDVATREVVPFSSMGVQVETQSQKDFGTAGTQIMKIIAVDLYDAGVPHDFDAANEDVINRLDKWNSLPEAEKLENEAYRLEQNHFNALSDLFDVNYNEFLDKWGIKEVEDADGNPQFNFKDKEKIYGEIEKSLTKHGVPDNILNQFQRDAEGNIPLELMADYKTVKFMIYSMVDKGVLSPKLHGGQKIQMSSALLDKLDSTYEIYYRTSKKEAYKKKEEGVDIPEGAEYVISNTALKFYQGDGKSKTSRMEVLISSRMKKKVNEFREKRGLPALSDASLIDYLNREQPKLLEGLGFRIPTQEMSSIDAYTIKGFLPESLGDAIAVPSELPTKAGSDFDVDKLNTYLNNYRIDKFGLPQYIQSFPSRQEFDAHYTEIFLDELEADIKDTEGKKVRTAAFFKIVQEVVFGLTDQDTIDHYTPIIRQKIGLEDDTVSLEDNMMSRLEKYGKKLEKMNDAEIQEALLNEFLDKTYRKSVENRYFESLGDIILSPVSFERLLSPNNVDEFTDAGGHLDQVNKLKGITETKSYNPTQMLSEQFMIKSRNISLKAKQQVGISAVSGSNTSNLQKFISYVRPKKISLDKENYVWDGATSDYLRFKHNTVKIGKRTFATMSRINKSDGKNILRYKSKYTNGAVDVAKNDWLVRWGASGPSFAVAVLAEGLGYNTDDIGLMINHPLVKEYMRIKDLKNSSVYEQNESLKKQYGALFSDSDYMQFFMTQVGSTMESDIEAYKPSDIVGIKAHITAAGELSDFDTFKNSLKDTYDKDLALSVIQEFLRLKENGTDLRMNIDASNHETVNLNSNYISQFKDSKAQAAEAKTVMAIDPESKKSTSVAKALRKYAVANRLAINLAKTEQFLYDNIFFKGYETLVNHIVDKMTEDDTKEVFINTARNQAEQFESTYITSALHSGAVPDTLPGFKGKVTSNINTIFKVDGEVFNFINQQKELNNTRTANQKVRQGTFILDYIDLRPISDNSPYFYIAVTNKPSGTDIFASNQFFESVNNLKDKNPKIYSTLMLGSILQSGNNFDRNSLVSYMLHEDYLEFSKALSGQVMNEEFFNKLSRVFVQNNARKDNGVSTRVEGKMVRPFILDLNNPQDPELTNKRITQNENGRDVPNERMTAGELVTTPDENNRLSELYIMPQTSWINRPFGTNKAGKPSDWRYTESKNYHANRPFLTGKGKTIETTVDADENVIKTQVPYEFLLEKVPIIIEKDGVKYSVFQNLPTKGTKRHIENDLETINSQYEINQQVNYKSVEDIKNILSKTLGDTIQVIDTRDEGTPTAKYSDVVQPKKTKIVIAKTGKKAREAAKAAKEAELNKKDATGYSTKDTLETFGFNTPEGLPEIKEENIVDDSCPFE